MTYIRTSTRTLYAALMAAGLLLGSDADAVRINADGHGQVLIYPYYTARSTISGNAFVTALSAINTTASPKAVKVRFFEGKAGAEGWDFNIFLAAYDVWTAGVVAAGAGAGLFTQDNSCTTPKVSNSNLNPTKLRNFYVGDGFGDSLDRTYEGYFEMIEMGAIDPDSALGASVTHASDFSGFNTSKPACTGLPITDAVPVGLSRPTGGLIGSVSYINVLEGTDFSVDAIALSQWSDKVQWSAPGSRHPNLADASPATSIVVRSDDNGDAMIVTQWPTGRDAVSAVFMVDRVMNDYSVEESIKAATDWILTMPTRRFHVQGTTGEAPFGNQRPFVSPAFPVVGEEFELVYYDREQQSPGLLICSSGPPCGQFLPFASTTLPWVADAGTVVAGTVLSSVNVSRFNPASLNQIWNSGWGDLRFNMRPHQKMTAPIGASTITDITTGAVTTNATVVYYGLPVIGFAAQSFSNSVLATGSGNVLSNYGGSFVHKLGRRIELGPKVVVTELFNTALGHYFMTANPDEVSTLIGTQSGWGLTGHTFSALAANSNSAPSIAPACRFYGSVTPGPNSHFYTSSAAECSALKAVAQTTPANVPRWNYEGIAFSAVLPAFDKTCLATSPLQVIRFYNNRGTLNDSNHRYVIDASVAQEMRAAGWIEEGVVMCGAL